MKKEKIILILAILIFLVPFLGIPSFFQDTLISILGLVIMAILLIDRYYKKTKTDILEKKDQVFEENTSEFDESKPVFEGENDDISEEFQTEEIDENRDEIDEEKNNTEE